MMRVGASIGAECDYDDSGFTFTLQSGYQIRISDWVPGAGFGQWRTKGASGVCNPPLGPAMFRDVTYPDGVRLGTDAAGRYLQSIERLHTDK